MNPSDFLTRSALLGIALATAAHGDNLILTGDERISGTVRAINPDGTVLLDTPLSPDPVALKADSVRKVLFSENPAAGGDGNCLVTLANGDTLPGTIEGIDAKNITLVSSSTGKLAVPRSAVASIQPGGDQPVLIYAGPEGFEGWVRDRETSDQWVSEKGAFRVEGKGSISRKLDLPDGFIVRFKVAWRNSPNLKVSMAATETADGEEQDRYYLTFNPAGMEIKRETATGKRFQSIITLNRLPQQFDGRQVTVELRIDRKSKEIQLWLNGESEGKWQDPMASPPDGNLLVFASSAGENEMQTISEIGVYEWNNKNSRRPAGERGDRTKDALLSVEGERFGGSLLETRKNGAETVYVFKNAFQEQAIEVPESAVSAIYFAEPEGEAENRDKGLFSLKLQGGGVLRVSECGFTPDEVEAAHPLLGKLRLKRGIVTAFERKTPEPKERKEKS